MTLKEFLEFTFQDITHFVGIIILMSMCIAGISAVAEVIAEIFKKK
jgi:hypothetical protein